MEPIPYIFANELVSSLQQGHTVGLLCTVGNLWQLDFFSTTDYVPKCWILWVNHSCMKLHFSDFHQNLMVISLYHAPDFASSYYKTDGNKIKQKKSIDHTLFFNDQKAT